MLSNLEINKKTNLLYEEDMLDKWVGFDIPFFHSPPLDTFLLLLFCFQKTETTSFGRKTEDGKGRTRRRKKKLCAGD